MGVGGVGANWYKDTTWTTIIAPELSTAQTAHQNAQSALNTAKTTYLSDFNTLNTHLQALFQLRQQGASQSDIDAAAATLAGDIAPFDTAQQAYNTALATFETAGKTLVQAQIDAETHIESLSDSEYQSFTDHLLPTI